MMSAFWSRQLHGLPVIFATSKYRHSQMSGRLYVYLQLSRYILRQAQPSNNSLFSSGNNALSL
jgi:hypothetical protein